MAKQKKHELLKYAYDNYPKGTRFEQIGSKETIESSGSFYFGSYRNSLSIYDVVKSVIVFSKQTEKWATIITRPEKIAVKVANEREFNLLMKFYDSKGWKSRSEIKSTDLNYNYCKDLKPSILATISNGVMFPNYDGYKRDGNEEYNPDNYTIIDFTDFAKENGIDTTYDVPLEDGTWASIDGDKVLLTDQCITTSDIKKLYHELFGNGCS